MRYNHKNYVTHLTCAIWEADADLTPVKQLVESA